MHDKFSDMRTFVQVVQASGFAAAAGRLGLAKSGVSRRIKELEARLGTQLVNRTTRSFRLTEAGTLFYERSLSILDAVEEAEELLTQDTACEPSGRRRLVAPTAFGKAHLLRHVSAFAGRYPKIAVQLEFSDRPVQVVGDGYDVAISVNDPTESSVVARQLGEVRYRTCASPDYLERHGVPRQPSELKHHAGLLLLGIEARDCWRYAEPGTGIPLATRIATAFESNSIEALVEYATFGRGIANLPDFAVAQAIASGQLRTILDAFQPPAHAIYAVYAKPRHIPARIRAFIDFLIEVYRSEHPTA